MYAKVRKIIFPALFFVVLFFMLSISWIIPQRINLRPTDKLTSPIIPLNAVETEQQRMVFLNTSTITGRIHTTVRQHDQTNKENSQSNAQDLLINTNGCKIPEIHPFLNKDFKYKINRERFKCPGPKRLTRIYNDRVELVESVNKKYFNSKVTYCSLQLIRRTDGTDNHFEYDSEVTFNKSTIFPGEFCVVNCYSRDKRLLQTDFHSRIYEKNESKSKIFHLNPKRPLNIHLIGIDSTSRNSFIRQMPNLKEFLLRNLSAYEYPGLAKVGYNTLPNIIPLLTGKHLTETKWKENLFFDDLGYIWKKYSDKGAITLLAEDRPRTGAFNFRKKGFFHSPTDYYIRPLTLAIASKKSHDDFCINSFSETEYILKYTKDFLDKFKDNFYFAFNFFTDWTHDNLNGASRWEGAMLDFIFWLRETGKLNNTLLFFFSDHGFQMGGFRDTSTGKYESNLPFAFLVVPEWFKEKYPMKTKALEINQKRLVTFFDVHATLIENLNDADSDSNGKKHSELNRNISLMVNITSNRTCQMAGIPLLYCPCIFQKEKMDVNNDLVRKAALAMVESMNEIIRKKAGNKCAYLTLEKLLYAYKDSVQSRYLVTFSVLPSQGQFESIAWLPPNTDKFEILTEAIRVNKYGKQSHCVKDLSLIMICLCKDYIPTPWRVTPSLPLFIGQGWSGGFDLFEN